ncbi:Glycosyltransferase 2-like domain-containing protein (plasmid) [Shinella sp. WSC3-e]|nr:Glycosyltransferase 2-like domain-containing protein [Shinella sp. WSC3-e]
MNPLAHYERWGRSEGRVILPAYLDAPETDPAVLASTHLLHEDIWPDAISAKAYLSWRLNEKVVGEPARMSLNFEVQETKRFLAAIKQCAQDDFDSEFVSVVMPAYNRGTKIGAAIESVLNQSWRNLELLIIDDGSTDNTLDVISKYSDKRIKLFKSNHKGVSRARNIGLNEANGEIIFYLDSDNTWTPHFIWLMVHSIRQSGARCGYAGARLQSPNGYLIGYRGEAFDWESCLAQNYVDMNVFCHRRDFIDAYGKFDEDLRRMVDWDLILRYTRNEDVFYAPFIGCIYSEDHTDMGRITTSQPIVSYKLVHFRNAMDCKISDAVGKIGFNIAIKIFAPYADRNAWGDFHYAESLAEAFERLGHRVRIDFRGQWYSHPVIADDVVIMLRGLEAYKPRPTHLNLLWVISHPDSVTPEEYNSYQGIFVASSSYSELLSALLGRQVQTLWQCTDPDRFMPFIEQTTTAGGEGISVKANYGIFIGNSRREYRQIVRWAVDANLPLEVIGQDWEPYLNAERIIATNAPNKELAKLYGSAAFVLNDHWESMRDFGIVSNRIFDVLAAGGQLISDRMQSIETLFGDAVVCVSSADELKNAVASNKVTRNDAKRLSLAETVRKWHSFDDRAGAIIEWIRKYLSPNISTEAASSRIKVQSGPALYNVGIVAPWSDPKALDLTIERIFSPLTTDHALSLINISRLESPEDVRAANIDCLILGPDCNPITQDMISAVKEADERGCHIILDIASADGNLASKAAVYYADEIWGDGRKSPSDYGREVTTIETKLDPRIWRLYRVPRVLVASEGPLRLFVIVHNAATDTKQLSALIRQIDIIERHSPGRIELRIIGAVFEEFAHLDWLNADNWPLGCDSYFQRAKWLLQNIHADVGMVLRGQPDRYILQMMALGITPVVIAPDAESIARRDIKPAALTICETEVDALHTLHELVDKPSSIFAARQAAVKEVWHEFNLLTNKSQVLDVIIKRHSGSEGFNCGEIRN